MHLFTLRDRSVLSRIQCPLYISFVSMYNILSYLFSYSLLISILTHEDNL